ncbi:MAG: DUF3379 domain-containing protein [Colwellia sp.]|nr:DUF3379 domain-containing protein [Colwellia sp.]MCW8865375.1 DUF3379 domain-containing protein [Colwellia sp.]MCW9080725.1 DUF3379 domain-containing protein [Colwellia sp.]
MDDLQFRRIIYADPTCQDEDILEAQKADPAKKEFAKELIQLDEKLKQAMNVPVPDGLCEKLILRQTLASHQQTKRKSRIHLALAASVAIIAGLAVNYLQFSSSFTNLGDYALAHVYHEQGEFSNSDSAQVSLTALNQKMTTFDGSFTQSLGELISADYCRFDGMKSLHLVFKGLTDTVTVFVVPKNEQLTFSESFSDSKFHGESFDFKNANVIVVADKNESLNQWQRAISDNITWSI